ncbi:hypothetical protein [Streptomyces phaeochromogenes]|uniref:hypothetical protein n=1 Tax=Streptomyces phaeochromogenes TaxID=1923 RepID=UPI002DD9E33F|nr:hypothetical protein [Streptomyces phaeochromogenes]WRZ31736.1 hypothetical protein OG931_30360 [Streptomyces phaeochromogenes]
MENPERTEQPSQPEQLDWFRQQPQHPAAPRTDADPVHTVWQLPRFRLGSRRFTGLADHALVFVTRKGLYETFRPPNRPTTVRRYVALYEVNTGPHAFQLNVPLPSRVDSFEFEVTADVSWRVVDPELFVKSQERDVPGLLTRELLPLMREASRSHLIEASAEAERAVQQRVRGASSLGTALGLQATCSIRLRRDAAERSHQTRLRTARHESEAAWPEHEASRRRERYEADRRAEQIRFYESTLARGGAAALALHLEAHPEETRLVLEHLQAGENRLADTQMHLIDHALDNQRLEGYLLQEPHKLIAERMTAILRTTALSEGEETPPPPPKPVSSSPAVESAPPKDGPGSGA